MATKYCTRCGAPNEQEAAHCVSCGAPFAPPPSYDGYVQYGDPSWPVRSKIAAGIFGILLGSFGVHKFYLGKIGLGIVYILFFWTGIPGIIGIIEGILYLTSSDRDFEAKNHVRVEQSGF